MRVGKTRFAAEGITRAAAAGMVMVQGECLPLAKALPLLPVAAAAAELLAAVASSPGHGVGLVAEDVHWADGATLDFLTFLTRAGSRGAVSVVATCRGDEAPMAGQVAQSLTWARGAAEVEEIRLGPLSRPEVARQAAPLAGCPVQARVVDELYARAEGNPFFTEQLVAAALASGADDGLIIPAGLPSG
jgi:predicted ATPase